MDNGKQSEGNRDADSQGVEMRLRVMEGRDGDIGYEVLSGM